MRLDILTLMLLAPAWAGQAGHDKRVGYTGPADQTGRSGVQCAQIIAVGGYRMPTDPDACRGIHQAQVGYTSNGRPPGKSDSRDGGRQAGGGAKADKPCRGIGAAADCGKANPGKGHGNGGLTARDGGRVARAGRGEGKRYAQKDGFEKGKPRKSAGQHEKRKSDKERN